jgi:mannose-1-phosphate guanylyltransferase/phosphomannomutase
MQAVMLAGGQSTRLRPITNHMPKLLVPVVNKPIAEHVIEKIRESGLTQCIFTLHYMADQIIRYFGDGSKFNLKIVYKKEEKPLGTAGSVKNVEEYLDDVFIVTSGDILFDYNLKQVIDFHLKMGRKATIVLSEVEDVSHFGVVETDSKGKIVRFIEKPNPSKVKSRLVNAGLYVLNRSVLELIEKNKKTDFSLDVFPKLVQEGELYGFPVNGFWYDVGTFNGLLKAQRDVLNGKTKIQIPGKKVSNSVYVGKDVIIEELDKISGPAVIGDNSKIGSETTIKYATIGRDCVIGSKAAVIESVLMNEVNVGMHSVLAGVVLGNKCRVSEAKSVIGPVGYAEGSLI